MKTPLSWISLYTPIQTLLNEQSVTDLAHTYSIHTAEVDDIIDTNVDRVVVGKVLSCEKHPESKKLSIVRVYLGEHGEEIILTGAANVVDATYVAVAMVGATLGEGFTIWERKMAGMMSRGMICSDDELGLASDRAEGIMILEEYWDQATLEGHIGKSFFDLCTEFPWVQGETVLLPLRDTTFEIDNKFITNRPDLFSVVGNAREWSVIFNCPYTDPLSGISPMPQHLSTVGIHTSACLAYSLVEMQCDVVVGPSPFGIRVMMEKAGLKPKLNIVDITNLIMTEYGQPMHAFDADKIVGAISVRMAQDGEELHALNDVRYTLTSQDIVIADERGPIALAGVIGGMDSAVSASTKRIFWESATFDAATVRLTAQRHAIRTDASTRYEKSLDPTLAQKVFGRVEEYLRFCALPYTILSVSHYIQKDWELPVIHSTFEKIDAMAGIKIPHDRVQTILEGLGFVFESLSDEAFSVRVPSWRATKDISLPEDIAEEVIRIYGYEHIPTLPLYGDLHMGQKNTERYLKDRLLQYFAERWWNEVYNYSFTNEGAENTLLNPSIDQAIRVINAYTEELTHLRMHLANGLFENIRDNIRHSQRLAFFEIGKVYGKQVSHEAAVRNLLDTQTSQSWGERKKIAGASTRFSLQEFRREMEVLFVELFGYVPHLSQGWEMHLPFLHPGVSGKYTLGDMQVAVFGKIHPSIAENMSLPENTWYFEMDFEVLHLLTQKKDQLFQKISMYPSIPRELNFIVDEYTETGALARDIFASHPWITPVFVDSVYRDTEKIGAGKKSVNFSFTLQSMDGTISDQEAQEIQSSIIDMMEQKWYSLRSI